MIWSAFNSIESGCLYKECVMQLSSFFVAASFFTSTECHLQYASLFLLDTTFFINMNPMNKINLKIKLYSLVLEIYLITSLISRAMY